MRWWLVIALIAASTGCGDGVSSPTGPSAPGDVAGIDPLPLQPGSYLVSFFGADAVGGGASGPIQPGCPGIGASRIGSSVDIRVQLERDGADWVGRATDGISTLVIRIRRGDGPPQLPRRGTRVVGRIAGVAHNTSSTNPNDDSGRTVSFGAVDADATLEGVLPPTVDVPGGTFP